MADTTTAKKAERAKPASIGNAHAAQYYRNPVGQAPHRLARLIATIRARLDRDSNENTPTR